MLRWQLAEIILGINQLFIYLACVIVFVILCASVISGNINFTAVTNDYYGNRVISQSF